MRDADLHNRVHFYGAAAQVMRRILVDHARRRRATKRDNERGYLDLEQVAAAGIDERLDLLALDDALERLAAVAPQPAKVVELRCFGGLSIEETATFLRIAPVTVKRHWSFARAWLFTTLASSGDVRESAG